MMYVQDLHSQTYILLFILAGMIWAGLAAIFVAVFYLLTNIPTPKPTNWEEEWRKTLQ